MHPNYFKDRPHDETFSEIEGALAAREARGSLAETKSAFVFAVNSKSSPQLIENVLSLREGLEPIERKKSRQSE